MKSTKKCVLVPYEKYQRMIQNLDNKNPVGNAAEDSTPLNEYSTPLNESANDDTADKLAEARILMHLPKPFIYKARALLTEIDNNSVLDWNKTGQLTVDGVAVPHSHIADLIKDALVTYKHFEPPGMKQFYSNLTYIPLSLIRNPKRRAIIQQGKGLPLEESIDLPLHNPAPPPGLPNKRKTKSVFVPQTPQKKKKLSRKDTWKQLWQKLT